ncbi:MAG: DUF1016 N-terminal domain-containing protein [Bacteroidota bacterium]
MKDNHGTPLDLLSDLRQIIEQGKQRAASQINSTLVLVYWQVGKRIREDVLQQERAEYGKEVVKGISEALVKQYGKSFEVKNLRRMLQFATVFPDLEIVVPAARQLSWSHFIILIPIKEEAKRTYYLQKAREAKWSKRELRRQIERKAFERNQIAQLQTDEMGLTESHTFRDCLNICHLFFVYVFFPHSAAFFVLIAPL